MGQIFVKVEEADALSFQADVLALKYAQAFHGLDEAVAVRMLARGTDRSLLVSKPWGFRYLPAQGAICSTNVLFIGVEPLRQFEYEGIRRFGRKVLTALAGAASDVLHLAVTVHGPGYGLDEREAFQSLVAGIMDAVESLDVPSKLEKISIIERNPGRATRLAGLLSELIPTGVMALDARQRMANINEERAETLRAVGYASSKKPHVFVAMPFTSDMDDVYHYGIQNAVNAAGYLCERADLSSFTGDVLQWIKERIATADLVIADLTSANPNVYLEVGFAWGMAKPTVLLTPDSVHLKFDIRGQRCLVYKSIRELEDKLTKELQSLSDVLCQVYPDISHNRTR